MVGWVGKEIFGIKFPDGNNSSSDLHKKKIKPEWEKKKQKQEALPGWPFQRF